jgi:hypothetical protein
MSIVFSDARRQDNPSNDNQYDDHSSDDQPYIASALRGVWNLQGPAWRRRDFLG